MATGLKYKHYVAIIDDETFKLSFVTAMSNKDKIAYWTAGKPAMSMSKSSAEDLQFGLVVNGYRCLVIKAPDFYEIVNPEESENKEV